MPFFSGLGNSELHPLLESKMESEKVIVMDGPDGETSEWVTTSGVINSSSSSSNGIEECKCILFIKQPCLRNLVFFVLIL